MIYHTRSGKISNYNEKLEYIGRIADDGYIFDTLFNRVGHVESDGRIFNEKLEYLGRVDSDGYVSDSSLNRIGRVEKDVVDRIYKKGVSSGNSVSSVPQSGGSYSGGSSGVPSPGGGMGCGTMIAIVVGVLFWLFVVIALAPGVIASLLVDSWYWAYLGIAIVYGIASINISKEKEFLTLVIRNYIACMILWVIRAFLEEANILDFGLTTIFVVGTMVIFAVVMASISYVIENTKPPAMLGRIV